MAVILIYLCYLGSQGEYSCNRREYVTICLETFLQSPGEQVIVHMKMVISTHYLKDGDYCVCTEYQ